MSRVGVYPGSFNPPTTAHLAVTVAAKQQRGLDKVVWSVSRLPLAKEHVSRPPFAERFQVLEEAAAPFPWLSVAVTDARLLAEIASGFDVLIMGADKWAQINELGWYESAAARDAALTELPELAIAPRPPLTVPEAHRLDLDKAHQATSSSAARAGATDLMLPAARDYAARTGSWL